MATKAEKTVLECAELAEDLLLDLHAREPNHETFDQVGFLLGRATVVDYIAHGELGCALHHLLYMIHESAIDFPRERLHVLHRLGEEIGEPNQYSLE